MIDSQNDFLEGLAGNGQPETVFWLLLMSVGLIAVLVGLKVFFQERHRNPKRHREWGQR